MLALMMLCLFFINCKSLGIEQWPCRNDLRAACSEKRRDRKFTLHLLGQEVSQLWTKLARWVLERTSELKGHCAVDVEHYI